VIAVAPAIPKIEDTRIHNKDERITVELAASIADTAEYVNRNVCLGLIKSQ